MTNDEREALRKKAADANAAAVAAQTELDAEREKNRRLVEQLKELQKQQGGKK